MPVDVVIQLCDDAFMRAKFPEPRLRGLSVTNVGAVPRRVYIHAGNWALPPTEFVGSRDLYRAYLIQHEIGHCLGWTHEPVPADAGAPCPVMLQQSLGTRGRCRASHASPRTAKSPPLPGVGRRRGIRVRVVTRGRHSFDDAGAAAVERILGLVDGWKRHGYTFSVTRGGDETS